MVPNLGSIVENASLSRFDQLLKGDSPFRDEFVQIIHVTKDQHCKSYGLRLMVLSVMVVDGFFRDMRLECITSVR